MERFDWPEPIRTLRGRLPAEMRILRGLAGLLGGAVLLGGLLTVLLGGNWQLGYGDDRPLAAILLTAGPAVVGILSPCWYWLGRPAWHWRGRPAADRLGPAEDARFLPGLAGSVLGLLLVVPVSATSRLPVQALGPLGVAVALGSPLWYWLLRPALGRRIGRLLPGAVRGPGLTETAGRILPVLVVLLVASLALTAVIALPVAGVGTPVSAGDLTVTVTDVRTVTGVTEVGGEGYEYGRDGRRLLLVHVAVENRGDTRRGLPGTSVGDVAVIAPTCSAQNFGEPSHNCNQVYVDGTFRANGAEYANYGTRVESTGGRIAPGAHLDGWLAFRLESRPDDRSGFEPMVIVADVGRWTLDEGRIEARRSVRSPA